MRIMSHMLIATLLSSAAMFAAESDNWRVKHPEWIWCDDFETDRSASYFEYDTAGGALTRTAGVGLNGSTGLRVVFSTGTVNAGNLRLAFGRTPSSYIRPVDAGTSDYRELYWRVYLRRQPGWTGGGGDKLSRATILATANWAQAAFGHVWSGGQANTHDYLVLDPASGTDAAGNLQTTVYNDFPNMRWLGNAQSTTPIFDAAHAGQWQCIATVFQFDTAFGAAYEVQFTTNLAGGVWSVVAGNLAGSGELVTITNADPAQRPCQFYRVRQLP